MGQLQELHIWHNGSGLATAWHLSLIIVADETNGERYCTQVVLAGGLTAKTASQIGSYSGLYACDPLGDILYEQILTAIGGARQVWLAVTTAFMQCPLSVCLQDCECAMFLSCEPPGISITLLA